MKTALRELEPSDRLKLLSMQDDEQSTPLHNAAAHRRADTTRSLLEGLGSGNKCFNPYSHMLLSFINVFQSQFQ